MADTPRMGATNLALLWEKIKNLLSGKVDKETGKGLSTNDYTTNEKTKLSGIATGAQVNVIEGVQVNGASLTPTNKIVNVPVMGGASSSAAGSEGVVPKPAAGAQNKFLRGDGTWQTAEANQNAFSNVKVGSTTIAADSKTDTVELAAGTLITLTPDATNDKVTIATTAEVNQNAFSNVKVGSSTIAAEAKTDTLELAGGNLITLTPDTTNDKVTIATTAEVNQNAFSKVAVSGQTTVEADSKTDTLNLEGGGIVEIGTNATNDTILISAAYSEATTSQAGLMSAADKTKLNTIDTYGGFSTISRHDDDHPGEPIFLESTADNPTGTNLILDGWGINIFKQFIADGGTDLEHALTFELDSSTVNFYVEAHASDATPLMNGTAAVGTSVDYAREDHVHPKDTSKANLSSPTFTGTPKAPTATAGTNTTQIATTAFVKTAIDNAVAGITQFQFQVVESLPATGSAGVIYLVAHSHGTGDAYDEYIWTGTAFEKIGNTDVDLSAYATIASIRELTTAEMNAILV